MRLVQRIRDLDSDLERLIQRHTKLDRDVALKVLPEAFTSDPDAREPGSARPRSR